MAYDIGAGVQTSQVPIRTIQVDPVFEFREGGPVLVGCSGEVSKRIYIILFRLAHIMFPSLDAWKHSFQTSDEITFDRDVSMATSKVFVDAESMDGCLVFSLIVSHRPINATSVRPNFLLSCLEVSEVPEIGELDTILKLKDAPVCLRTVRELQDVLVKVKGRGKLTPGCTPVPSPRKQQFFQSPAKKPMFVDSCMDIKTAVTLIELGTSSEFRDGSLYIQSICKSSTVADIAVRKGIFRALVTASTSLLNSPVMGKVEQLTILTLTASQVLDHCSNPSTSSKTLVGEIIESLGRPVANYILALQFTTAMIHRPDVKDSAIELQLYNALSAMYISKLPLLEPLAAALTASSGTNRATNTMKVDNMTVYNELDTESLVLAETRASVPLLGLDTLPIEDEHLSLSPANSGLTRATRRENIISKSAYAHRKFEENRDTDRPQSASHELDHLAQALGESLVAQDLPALIGLRRRLMQQNNSMLNLLHTSNGDERSSMQHVCSTSDLKAHKVSPADESDDDLISEASISRIAGISECHPNSERNEAECFSSKDETFLETLEVSIDICPYLINAMIAAHSPFPGCYQWEPDPSALITADILSFPAHIYEGNAYINNCLRLLARISSAKENSGHIFLVAIGNKLRSLVLSRSYGTEMGSSLVAYYLGIALEYVLLCSDSQMSDVFSQTALQPVLQILSSLQAEGSVFQWKNLSMILFNFSARILDRVIGICEANRVGQEYIRMFFGEVDNSALSLMKDISRQTLLSDVEYPLNSSELADIEKNTLALFASLVNLINGMKGMDLGEGKRSVAGDDILCKLYRDEDPEILNRSYCLQYFSFLILPGSSLIRCTLEGEIPSHEMEHLRGTSGKYSLSSRFIRLRNGVFALLQGLFSANQSPYIVDKELTDYYVRLHFIRLLKLYHNPTRDHQAIFLCRQHLAMLCTLAQAARKAQSSHASKRFQHLSVVGFFMKEMSLEYEALESNVGNLHTKEEDGFELAHTLEDKLTLRSASSIHSSNDGSLFDELYEEFKGRERHKSSVVPPLSLNFSPEKFNKFVRQNSESSPLLSAKRDLMIPSGTILLESTDEALTGQRTLERQGTSAAISLHTPLRPPGAHDDLSFVMDSNSRNNIPAGFTFTGDLDEDVDRLEALGLDDSSETGLTSDHSTDAEISESEDVIFKGKSSRMLHDKKHYVPRLSISSSMRSSLHKRNESAELFKDSDVADPSRSFFGNLEKEALGNGKMQAVRFLVDQGLDTSSREHMSATSNLETERSSRLLYQDEDLHILAIRLIFMLIIDENGILHSSYCDRLPWERKMLNIPFILQQHLNAEPTIGLLPRIESDLYENVGEPAVIFLKILSSEFFRPDWYLSRNRISGVTGAYATVHRCSLPWWAHDQGIVLKVIDAPKYNHDRCSQVEFYSEVYIHQKLSNHPRVCQMLDFGFDTRADALVLVLEEYKCSLKQWRLAQDEPPHSKAKIYWAIFREILVACIEILHDGVVHFDLKCDNILLNPLDGVSEEAFWRGTKPGNKLMSFLKKSGSNNHLSFKVVLGDFGESVYFPGGKQGAESGSTLMARGTDAFKSPEMLMIGGASQVHQVGYDRRRQHGAGAASDVWSLGCLLFELFTGEMLFSDNDWLQLAARVTSPGSQLITSDKHELIAGLPGVQEMLSFILVRDPMMRPTLDDVLHKLDTMSLDNYPGSPAELTPRSSRTSPGTAREKSQSFSDKDSTIEGASQPSIITCMIHVAGNLSVCPLSVYNRQVRDSHTLPRKQVIILSSKLVFSECICSRQTITSYSKSVVLESVDLENCLWNAQALGDHPCLYRCPIVSATTAKTLSSWINVVLSMTSDIADLGISNTLIISDNMDQLAAFVALAILAKQSGSMYRAMVLGAHCGLDRHLQKSMLDILCRL